MSGAICICWWHKVSVDRKMKRGRETWIFSPCASFDDKHPISGWVLTMAWTLKGTYGLVLPNNAPITVPRDVWRRLAAKTKNVRTIQPYPG